LFEELTRCAAFWCGSTGLYLPIGLLAQALFCFFFANALLFGEALGLLFDSLDLIDMQLPEFWYQLMIFY